jgi:NitT/TauT family transport system substrate-binding protein
VDVALVAEIPLVLSAMRGEKLAIVATIFSGERDHAVIVRRDRGITVPTNLRDKRFGVTNGTTSAYVADMVLAGAGLVRANVELVNLAPDALVAAMKNGEIDAASTWQPYLRMIQDGLGPRGLTFDGFDVQGLFSLTINLAVREDFVQTRPGTTEKMLRALIKAAEFIKANPDEARRITSQFTGLDDALLRELWRSYRFGVRVNQTLPVALEGVSRWVIQNQLNDSREVPNFSKIIVPEPLLKVSPGAVSLIR